MTAHIYVYELIAFGVLQLLAAFPWQLVIIKLDLALDLAFFNEISLVVLQICVLSIMWLHAGMHAAEAS